MGFDISLSDFIALLLLASLYLTLFFCLSFDRYLNSSGFLLFLILGIKVLQVFTAGETSPDVALDW